MKRRSSLFVKKRGKDGERMFSLGIDREYGKKTPFAGNHEGIKKRTERGFKKAGDLQRRRFLKVRFALGI